MVTSGVAAFTEALIARFTVRATPLAERLRLLPTAARATATAIELARAATGRDLVVTFAGHDHAHVDPQSIVVPYNDLDTVRDAFAAHPGRIAAVLTEAVGVHAGVLAPLPGFNGALALVVARRGALLVLDETHTAFRVGPAGWWGLEADGVTGSTGWRPDLVILGGFGAGLPLAALGGRAAIVGRAAPSRAWNADAVASAEATLRLATPDSYARVDRGADAIVAALHAAFDAEGVAHVIPRAGLLFSIAFRPAAVLDDADARDQESWRYPPFARAMAEHGAPVPASARQAWFVAAPPGDPELDRILDAVPHAARAAAQATPEPAEDHSP